MDFSEDDPVTEKMLRMGRMFGWFDVSLKEKIDALQKEIKMSKETNILAFTGNREEMASDDDDKLTTRDIVDISADNNDDEIVNGVDSDDNTDGNIGGTDDSGDDNISDDNGSRDNEHNDDGNIGGTDDSGDNGSRDNEHNDDGNIGGTDDSGDTNISDDNGSRDNEHNDDGNIGGTDDSGDDNISDDNGSRDNKHNDDGNIGGTDDSGDDNISDDNGSRDNEHNDDGNIGGTDDSGDNGSRDNEHNDDGNIGGTDDSGDTNISDDNGSRDNEHNDDGNIGGTDDSGDDNISDDNGSRDNKHNDDGNIGGTDDSGDDNISDDNGSRDNEHNDDGNIGGTDDSGDDNISDDNGSRDNEHNNDGNIGGTDNSSDNISDDNGSRDNDDDDDIIQDSDDGGNDVNDGESDDNENDGNDHGDNDDEEYGNIDDSVDGGGSVNDDSVLIDNSDESDDGDNYGNSDIDNHYLYPLDSVANSCEINEVFPTSTELEMQLVISKDNNQVPDDNEDTHEINPVEEFESMRSTDGHSFMASDVKTISTKLFNREITETTDGTESNEESQFVQVPCSYSYSKDHSIESNVCDNYGGGNNDNVDEDGVVKHTGNEDEQGTVMSPLVNSIKIDDGDLSTGELFTRPVSSMTELNNDDISDSPDIPASLGARLFKKYNPEKSESDMDDFEMFLQKMRTPKKPIFSDKEKKLESKSLDEFIVDGDNDDLEEDVFMDPGFTEEFDFDSDKENDDCIEITTPVVSYTPFKTPTTDFSWKTPKSTKPKSHHTGLSSSKHSRPKSVLEDLLTPYSTEKHFKMNREKLVKDLFELYNRTVFDNQLPSDFQVTWNKKMRSTAGFCYYSRKNGLRMSRIELADKVIDSSDRLRDTLVHEMCHAASWVISDVKAGHGPVWKKWTRRANFVHQDLPPISRCHSYTISTKYTYRCTKCSNTFGRHSKSVNLEKSRCAHCHGRLELVPQLKKDGTPQTRTPSRFAMFVKENFARIKKDNGTFSHQEVMKALSSEFAKLCR